MPVKIYKAEKIGMLFVAAMLGVLVVIYAAQGCRRQGAAQAGGNAAPIDSIAAIVDSAASAAPADSAPALSAPARPKKKKAPEREPVQPFSRRHRAEPLPTR